VHGKGVLAKVCVGGDCRLFSGSVDGAVKEWEIGIGSESGKGNGRMVRDWGRVCRNRIKIIGVVG
jgi:hypothetical protein